MYKVDLNSDLGESFGAYTIGSDDRVLALVSSANVACGFHAGDPSVMGATVAACRAQGVAVGAHPGFPDLVGFGRRQLAGTPDQAYGDVLYQIGALAGFCRTNGALLQHVKPHGALYNMACKDLELARAVTRAVRDFDPALVLLAPAGSCLQQAAKEQGVPFGCEVFADRAYEADGSLRDRRKPGAMITDTATAIDRVVRMVKEQKVTAYTGEDIPVVAHSVCVHGDGARALEFVQALRSAFAENGIAVAPLAEVIADV